MRSCYSVDMQFDDDANVIRNVTWFFAADGAKWMDFPHLYGSDNWVNGNCRPPSAGERWDSLRPWTNGKKPCFLDGKGGFCGEKDWWMDGTPGSAPPVSYGPYGIPVCCPAPLAQPWYDNLGDFTGRKMVITGQPGVGWSVNFDGFGDYQWSDAFGNFYVIAESNFDCANATVPEGFAQVRWVNLLTSVDVMLVLVSYDLATFTGTWKSPTPPAGAPVNLKVLLTIPKRP